ncbi:Protein VPS-51 a [Aphelenchoides avenae]|nr:Protein VPS-51 a [Aphelenchus avenae]
MTKLQEQLTDRLSSKVATSEEITEAVDLLRKLGVPEDELRKRVMTNWNENSHVDLANIEMHTSKAPEKPDILEFADAVCNFLANLSLWSSLSMSLFGSNAEGEIMETTEKHCVALERLLTERFESDHDVRECAQYVSALDRIYRKLSACSRLITAVDLHKLAISTVIRASRSQIRLRRRHIVATVVTTLTELYKAVESGPIIDQEAAELVKKLEQAFTTAVKTALGNLLLFTASDITFSSLDPSVFYVGFGVDVHEEVVVGSTRDLLEMPTYSDRQEKEEDVALMMLIYAQFLKNVRTKQLNYLLDLCQEQYRLSERKQSKVTSQDSLQNEVGTAADNLLRKYVTAKGSSIGQILVSSMESRDWLNCSKPQSVRAAVKRVVEYVEKADHQIRLFVDDCTKKERTPDSVRSASSRRGPGGSYDTSSLSSALEKLWVERSEATSLDFKHDSILEAIVRFVLKCMVDASRQQFFSANGFEQIQIDCYYLKQRLWKFVPDEHVLNSLIDEVISSSVNQCSEPKILDPATVKDICDKDSP